jgi:uncharacterized repeat protein (TIGR01451 family)
MNPASLKIAARASLALLLVHGAAAFAQPAAGRNDDGTPRRAASSLTTRAPRIPEAASRVGVLAPGSLTTLFGGGNSFAGNTFDLVPAVNMTVTSFDVNLDPPGTPTTMAIYWRTGTASGFESDPAGWTLLGTAVVTPAGLSLPTPVPIGGLVLTAGNTYGIYVDVQSYPSTSIQYTNGGPTTFSNADLELTTYYGKGNPAFTGASFFPRQWNGTVYYDTLDLEADLSLTKTGVPATVAPLGTVTWTLTVTNNGPSDAPNTVVTDTLPAGFYWTSDNCAAGPPVGDTLTWNVGALANGASASCQVVGQVWAAPGEAVVNTASVSSDATDPTPATAAATVLVDASLAAVPTTSPAGLAALAVLLAGAALLALRRAPLA